jgi:hypothetical protein
VLEEVKITEKCGEKMKRIEEEWVNFKTLCEKDI